MQISFTVDLEDPTLRYATDGRYIAMTYRILELCDRLKRKATFFTVGRVAESAPQLIRDIAAKGHEIAYHSHNHVSLTDETPDNFKRECTSDIDRLEQLAGYKIVGFRAPRFSLTPQSQWTLDILAELGFRYSSSIMPTEVSLFGFPNVPHEPFAWPNGMIEFPLPVANLGKYRLPYLGGIYLYTMPFAAIRGFLSKTTPREVLWTYTHPYDFDSTEKFSSMPHTPLWISLTLWFARKNAAKKIQRVLESSQPAPPLRDRIPTTATRLPS
jgi:polysaccharide deacetylase family protein (PEP-CTERM system associated)